ncbi:MULTISPECIES: sensor histidine kinase [Aminobacter]|uniref:histidine kinase n=1 Tax=Aminobacter ciceronei TaxID=150723 RepID=A0ABR6CB44_9HYPH|nr:MULTISPECIES: sensor histidine kinase [Aminobacter]MBA8908341.1 two-component system sensor histidine kinase TctE [Aminobacter ciceronei]MBA9022220.1 two-component system sensor histidine kinase TctE [Aminobacter ciceronei]MRX34862.1 sensor histidine kinase [Aminobacter sp. MDW-2]QNH34404.1 sensor histidine kinase N-terminal domain-containing protein [Aminobacter sp. MDW-2]
MARTRPYSLRRRLLLWLLVPLVALGLIALADTYNEAVETANAVSDRVLAGSALAIAERVVVAEDGALEVDIPYVALEMLTSAAQDRVFYRVDGPDGFITGYQTLPVIDGLELEESGYEDASFRGEPIRLTSLSRAASTGATSIPFVVTIAETTIARTQLAQTILLRSALRLAILIGSAAAIVWFAVTFSLRPLYRLRDAIAERNPDDLHPIEQSVPKEVRGLVDTVNSFMGRLGSALGAMRHFTGNASHQLRTPLTIIRTQLALASRAHSLEEARQAARMGDEAVAHAERVIAQLLLLAKVDEAASDRLKNLGAVNLTKLAQQLTADRVTQAHAAGIDLGFEGEEPLFVRGEPMLLGEMIRNLIENVLAYAGSDAEATVKVLDGGTEVVLEVEDTGPGIAPADLEGVRQRFVRGRAGDKPGAGLGLPIVEEIASLFGGRLELLAGADGRGLRVSVALGKAADA